MDGDHFGPEQARGQLAASRHPLSPSAKDRKVHAAAIAVVGLSLGLAMGTQNVVGGIADAVLSFVLIALALGAMAWAERASRTVPRRARRWTLWGIAGSFALALFAVLPWLNLRAQSSPNTWPMALLAALIVAVPCLVASIAVARGSR